MDSSGDPLILRALFIHSIICGLLCCLSGCKWGFCEDIADGSLLQTHYSDSVYLTLITKSSLIYYKGDITLFIKNTHT